MYGFIKEGTSGSKGNGSTGKGLAVQVRGPECRPPEPDVDAGQIRWPTYNLSTWEVKAAVPGRFVWGGQLRDPASIYMEKDTWHQVQASVKTYLDLSHTCPHMCKHTYVHTHAYHIHEQEGVRGRETPFLTLWCFLGLDFNQTKSLLLLFLLSSYPALARHRKGSIPNQSDQKTN